MSCLAYLFVQERRDPDLSRADYLERLAKDMKEYYGFLRELIDMFLLVSARLFTDGIYISWQEVTLSPLVYVTQAVSGTYVVQPWRKFPTYYSRTRPGAYAFTGSRAGGWTWMHSVVYFPGLCVT